MMAPREQPGITKSTKILDQSNIVVVRQDLWGGADKATSHGHSVAPDTSREVMEGLWCSVSTRRPTVT